MKPGRLLALVAVAGAFVGLEAWLTRVERAPSDSASAAPPAFAREPRGAELGRPSVELAAAEAPAQRALDEPARAEKAPARADQGAARTKDLRATVGWLRQVLRSPELTEAQALALEELELRGVEITDADLAMLANLTGLRKLSLSSSAVTDQGLTALGGLALESLDLRGTKITGQGLGLIATAGLHALHLTDTQVSADELARLPPMPALETLKLNRLPFTDASLESLVFYPSLRHLELDQTGLTDAGLRRLLALQPDLTRIEARGTAVTSETVNELRASYPRCEIVLDPGLGRLRPELAGGR